MTGWPQSRREKIPWVFQVFQVCGHPVWASRGKQLIWALTTNKCRQQSKHWKLLTLLCIYV